MFKRLREKLIGGSASLSDLDAEEMVFDVNAEAANWGSGTMRPLSDFTESSGETAAFFTDEPIVFGRYDGNPLVERDSGLVHEFWAAIYGGAC
jgi:hypothetical protein